MRTRTNCVDLQLLVYLTTWTAMQVIRECVQKARLIVCERSENLAGASVHRAASHHSQHLVTAAQLKPLDSTLLCFSLLWHVSLKSSV
jgi:hypothetical protein